MTMTAEHQGRSEATTVCTAPGSMLSDFQPDPVRTTRRSSKRASRETVTTRKGNKPVSSDRIHPRRRDNDAYGDMVIRWANKYLDRLAAEGDPADMAKLYELISVLQAGVGDAARACYAAGHSWGEIADYNGISDRAAYKRWAQQERDAG